MGRRPDQNRCREFDRPPHVPRGHRRRSSGRRIEEPSGNRVAEDVLDLPEQRRMASYARSRMRASVIRRRQPSIQVVASL